MKNLHYIITTILLMCLTGYGYAQCPTLYTTTGGGSTCNGTQAVTITLVYSSQVGVNYNLRLNGTDISPIKAGTGAPLSFSVTTAGTYQIIGKKSGCANVTMTGSAVVTSTSTPSPAIALSGTGCSTLLTASGGATYQWRYNTTTGTPISTATTLSVKKSGTYYLTATSSCGSSAQTSRVVNSITPVAITPSGPPVNICPGSFTLTASGGTGYQWTFPNSTTSTNAVISPLIAGTYTLTATNICNVQETTSIPITVLGTATPPSVTPVKIAHNSSTTLTASGAQGSENYRWFDASQTFLNTGTYTTPALTNNTTYYVSKSSTTQCESSKVPLVVTVNRLPVVNAGPDVALILPTKQTALTGTATDPDGDVLTYAWSLVSGSTYSATGNGTLNLALTNLTVGTYVFRLSVNDGLNTVHDDVQVSVNYPANNYNYVKEQIITIPGVQTSASISSMAIGQRLETINYFDGLGRPLQVVTTQGSPSGKDVVQPVAHDDFGREAVKYLPYVSTNTNGWYKTDFVQKGSSGYTGSPQYQFYNNASAVVAQDNAPYSEIIFEASPLNRPTKQVGTGAAWQTNNKHIGYNYLLNTHGTGSSTTQEKVIAWHISSGVPARAAVAVNHVVTGGYYANGQLSIRSTKDEHGNEVREYINKSGQIILKKVQVSASSNLNSTTEWALTYYLFDDLNNLRFVFPPELSKILHTNADSYTITSDNLTNWAFQYTYDSRNRMITKQVPGTGMMYMVYDKYDRLVATQDAVQRPGGYWTFTKYDAFNRPILTGIKDTTASLSQANMQAGVTVHYAKGWTKYGETYVGDVPGNIHGYSNKAYPVLTSATVTDVNRYLSVTYYDNYLFKSLWPSVYGYVNDGLNRMIENEPYNQPTGESTTVKGQVTGTKTKVLDGGVAGGVSWLRNINYYDTKSRIIQTISDNYKQGTDRVSNLYDFTGKVIQSKSTHMEADIAWKDLTSGVTRAGERLYRSAGGSDNNQGAASAVMLPANTDGWFEFTHSNPNDLYIGFSAANTGTAFTSIDYCLQVGGSVYRAIKPGQATVVVDVHALGDVFRIERTAGVVRIRRNGLISHTFPGTSTSALLIDVSFVSGQSSVLFARSSFTASSHSVLLTFDYDLAGRLINTWHKLDEGQNILLSKNEYNELGQLIDKKLHSTESDGSDARQSVDYRYNIRGWLTAINDAQLTNDLNDPVPDFFGIEVGYNEAIGIGNSPQYTGSISGVKWSNYLKLGGTNEKAYTYSYDAMDRIIGSTFRQKTGTWTTLNNGRFAERGFQYDLNGNITRLVRNDGRTSGRMDSLIYNYGTGSSQSNKLLYVTDAGDATTGFKDGNMSGNDYAYDLNGNLTVDKNKGISGTAGNVIAYNFLNLPERVQKSATQVVTYIYDASGRKLRQELTDGAIRKATDYSGEYIYENDTLRLINHDEGRILPKTSEYQYHLKDHLGNVRLTFTTKFYPKKATMETAHAGAESGEFIYYNEAVKINAAIFDHTNNGSTNYATRLTGSVNERYGLAKSLRVMKGDTVRATVYAKYLDTNSGNWTTALNNLMTAIANGTAPGGTVVDGGLTGSTGGVTPPHAGVLNKGSETGTAPKAYLNFLVFNDNMTTVLDAGFVRLTEAAREYGQDGAHEELFKQLVITEPGYVYLYLSNDHYALGGPMIEVYFDDFTVEHIAPVVQQDDYYAFGMEFNSYQQENSTRNNYVYNGQEKQDELGLGWLDYGARMYQPEIARWNGIDPLASHFSSSSPYSHVLNNPIRYKDVGGMGPTDPKFTGSGNVVIIISDGPSQKWDTSTLDDTKWDYGVFYSLSAAYKWIQNTYGRSGIGINHLVIRTHGAVGRNEEESAIAASENGALQGTGFMKAKDFEEQPAKNANVRAIKLISKHFNKDAKVLFTACGAAQLGDRLAKAIFAALLGDQLNLTIYNNGSNSQLGEKGNKIKVGIQLNEREKQWKPWTVTTKDGSDKLTTTPGLSKGGGFIFFPIPPGTTQPANRLKKMASPYHPHKDKQKW